MSTVNTVQKYRITKDTPPDYLPQAFQKYPLSLGCQLDTFFILERFGL